jgi:hypothetical protein
LVGRDTEWLFRLVGRFTEWLFPLVGHNNSNKPSNTTILCRSSPICIGFII